MDLLYREALESDLSQIAALFPRAYEADFPQAEWLWKYFACPHGKCSVVAESDGRVVAHYGGWRTRLRGSAGTVEAAVLCDTMTDPSIRVSGRTPVLQRLHEAFLGLCRKRGVQFCYGFPNLAAARFGSRFLGYELLGPLLFLRRPVSAGGERPACAVRIGDVFPEEHDRLAARLHAQPGWRADRSRAALNWRFHARPTVYYRVVHAGPVAGDWAAYAVATTSGELAQLVDLQVDPGRPEALGLLLTTLEHDLGPHGVRWLEVGIGPGRLAEELQARHGFTLLPDSPLTRCSGFVRDDFDWPPVAAALDPRLSDVDVF